MFVRIYPQCEPVFLLQPLGVILQCLAEDAEYEDIVEPKIE